MMNESVGQAFQGGARTLPSSPEGMNVARTIANESDETKFDALLVRSVARFAKSSLDTYGWTRYPGSDSSTSYGTGRDAATSAESIMRSSVIDMMAIYGCVIGPILTAIKSESSAIIAKLHRESVRSADPLSYMGGSSAYIKELTEKSAFVKSEVLARLSIEDVAREWPLDIVRHVLRAFVLHVSIVKPLDETRKLQLTGDMTELEFALGTFVSEGKSKRGGGGLDAAGSEYRALRALQPLLFLETVPLAEPGGKVGLPPLVVLHHVLAAEYVRWVEEHSEEAVTLIDGSLTHWEKTSEMEGGDPAATYLSLARDVLANARAKQSD
ncbi:hypothetical protein BJV78DRAFT_1362419 [Lactifluus subvellereus]|nr:hypothetical protein BJV78DRAFT_1362419 [Lactifluus subvellereus]